MDLTYQNMLYQKIKLEDGLSKYGLGVSKH